MVRNGFVSNSSSSSFIITDKNIDTIRAYIEKLLEARNILHLEEQETLDDICNIYEVDDVDIHRWEAYKFHHCGDTKPMTLEQFKLMEEHTGKIPGILIESTSDNSIPWSIQEALENIGERYHWG